MKKLMASIVDVVMGAQIIVAIVFVFWQLATFASELCEYADEDL